MKAMQLTDYDQPLVLRDIPVPTAEAGQVTVKIHTCGLNFGDLLIIKGTYQERPPIALYPWYGNLRHCHRSGSRRDRFAGW